jgi:hypothetical protein
MDLPSKVGSIDPSIALTSDVERVVSVGRESHVKILKGIKSIL